MKLLRNSFDSHSTYNAILPRYFFLRIHRLKGRISFLFSPDMSYLFCLKLPHISLQYVFLNSLLIIQTVNTPEFKYDSVALKGVDKFQNLLFLFSLPKCLFVKKRTNLILRVWSLWSTKTGLKTNSLISGLGHVDKVLQIVSYLLFGRVQKLQLQLVTMKARFDQLAKVFKIRPIANNLSSWQQSIESRSWPAINKSALFNAVVLTNTSYQVFDKTILAIQATVFRSKQWGLWTNAGNLPRIVSFQRIFDLQSWTDQMKN